MAVQPITARRMPAEWEPHAATLLAWPHRRTDWPDKFAAITWLYPEIIRLVAEAEPVMLIVPPSKERAVGSALKSAGVPEGRVSLVPARTNRSWVRDSGPIGVCRDDGSVELLHWHFNGWAKYDDWRADADLPPLVAEQFRLPLTLPRRDGRRIVLEGGAIDTDGAGTLLTTEECLLSDVQQRNAGFDRSTYEGVFREYLGIEKVIWLGHGIVGDDTHGHVDDLTRFVAPATVVTTVCEDEADENFRALRDNWERLQGATDAAGRKLTVVALPLPRPVVFRGQRLPASYANFYIVNGRVLVPTFHDRRDRTALGVLAELMPDREVIGVHAVDLVWGLGTLHCLSQQIPASRR